MTGKPPPTAADVEVLERTTPFRDYFRIDRYRLRHRLFDGGWSQPFSREVFERGHAITVVLYDPDRDALVLIEQFRMGCFAALSSPWLATDEGPWLVEPVAGIIDPGETPEDVVRREAMEEAGCTVTDLVFACKYLASPGGSSEVVHVYCGKVDSSGAGGIHGLDHEHEDIRVLVVPVDEALAWLDAGRLLSATAIIGLQWFRQNREALIKRWRTAGDA